MVPEIKKYEDDKIDGKKMMNAMITKMIKNEKNYFTDFQCVAGSVLHNAISYIFIFSLALRIT